MQELQNFFSQPLASATVGTWVQFLGTMLGAFLVLFLGRGLGLRRLDGIDDSSRFHRAADMVEAVLRSTNSLTYFGVGILVGFAATPNLPSWFVDRAYKVALALLIIQVGLWIHNLVTVLIRRKLEAPEAAGAGRAVSSAAAIVRFFALTALWTALAIVLLDNMGVRVAPLIAGLGVGGIAIGFALQSILGDVFCSVAIILDKPFEVGDFIIVGTELGTVERIGIKTTRVRALSGEQITFSNADLVGSRIHNYGRMQQRRIVFLFGVVYQTPPEVAERIGAMVRDIITGIEKTRFDRAHLKSFGASSLDYEVVYFVLTGDFNVYMDIQQRINLAIMRRFREEGIDFAYPTQTLFVEKVRFDQTRGDDAAPAA